MKYLKESFSDLKEVIFYRVKENEILKRIISDQEKLINLYESIYSSKNLANSAGD